MTGNQSPPAGGSTPADEVRDDLSQCEKWVAGTGNGVRSPPPKGPVGGGGQNIVPEESDGTEINGLVLLRKLDRVADELARLERRGADLRAERVRFDNVLSELQRREKLLLAEMGPALAAQRPADARWWWYLDERAAANRRRRLKRAVGGALVALGVLALLYVIYDHLLAAPPHVREARSHIFQGEQVAVEGDLVRAIAEFETATALDPENAEAHLWLGVLRQMTGRVDLAAIAFGRARALLGDQVAFLVERGLLYVALNDYAAANKDALNVIGLAPERPEGYYMLGGAAEQSGDLEIARDAFQKAAELANEVGAAEMEVTARVRLAAVLQQLASPSE